jgi:predicted GNAT superfamily acetyltransferase
MKVRELTTAGDLREAAALFAKVWRPTDPMPLEMLRVVRHLGGYISGAYDADALIGACAAFPTASGGLHSHITGVTARSHGVGFAIKLHQREWALRHGVTTVTWTFDPLVRRNAYFNLAKLAARADEYLEDFYGDMPDELNVGAPSDRLLVTWELAAPAVAAAAEGHPATAPGPGPDTTIALTTDLSTGSAEGARLAVGTPEDISALRTDVPGLAADWRRAQRAALGGALAAGYRITGFTRSGHYILEAR